MAVSAKVKKPSLSPYKRVDIYERGLKSEPDHDLGLKYKKDKRMRQYKQPDFDTSYIRKRVEAKKAKALAEKELHERQMKVKKERLKAKMVEEGRSPEEIQKEMARMTKKAEELAVSGEKLKTILRVGGFNFNAKERDILNKILNKG